MLRWEVFAQDASSPYWLTEFCPGSDLVHWLWSARRLDDDDACLCASQLAEGLRYLHSFGVVFRNLKPDAVLVGWGGKLKLGSMLLAKQLGASGGAVRRHPGEVQRVALPLRSRPGEGHRLEGAWRGRAALLLPRDRLLRPTSLHV